MKNWMKGTNAVILAVAAVGIFILLTIFLYSLKGTQWDLTKSKKYTLSDQTITALKQVKDDIHVTAFTEPGQGAVNRQITDLLEEYHKRNSKFTWEEVDPKKKPAIAEKYKIEQYNTLVFEMGSKTKNVDGNSLFGQGSTETSYAFSGEEKFTQAILTLMSNEKKSLYLISGHGELTAANAAGLTAAFTDEGYEVKDLNLFKEAAIPEDAKTLMVLGPQSDISDKEAELLKGFVKDKGKLFVSLGLAKGMDTWKNWNDLLNTLGVKNDQALIVESKQTLQNDPLTFVPSYGYHEITSKLDGQGIVVALPAALALGNDANNADYQSTALLRTSDAAIGKVDLSKFLGAGNITANDLKATDKDLKGPLDLAYAVSTKTDSKPKAVVIGNTYFLTNDVLSFQGNKDFILNSVGWLDEQQTSLTIRPREDEQMQQVFITQAKGDMILYGTTIGIPLVFLLIGGAIWWRRRKG
ncbi:MAG: GldG family protein [Paenibacillaceae bacterium]|nr:GldG family protein [Paenibacillaceae bacterium]